mmetsp:Transcript_240/g.756  ORF Transcript_240/g.756 Transcript_240/m.756 type:complete len:324 (-) Transcript_240:185-1156(-)|eukprot:CAMPEP_0117682878 /NCGR_PEP_ID=MMETSP0804-20121206/19986_1 /TAXON_ID=1074897 /ORGANISM="Tetraselmis astigmatica, Strain CCMP880" /LENGTH=323 /DNA_ID=CAMNT_0005493203 /DNA_START=494 /DNA_END=1465 /DNA_ORIENTATION=-
MVQPQVQDFTFELWVLALGAAAVIFTTLGMWLLAMERKKQRQAAEEAIYEMYMEQKRFQTDTRSRPSDVKTVVKQGDSYVVSLEQQGGTGESTGEEEAIASGGSGVYGVRMEDLADPPLEQGSVGDLNTGKALLLSVSMQKVMPRPSGGLLSRLVYIDEVPQLRLKGERIPLYLLHPGADCHSLGISVISPSTLSDFPISSGLRVSVRYMEGAHMSLPVTVDSVTAQQLDVSAIWNTKGLEQTLADKREPVPIKVSVAFDGFPTPATLDFDIKVQFTSPQTMVPRPEDLYKVPVKFITQAPRWALEKVQGQPVVLKFNTRQTV